MGWRDILRSPDPSRALYLALRANPTASRIADTIQGGFEGAMEGLGNIGHVATVPARALNAAAYNTAAAPGTEVDVSQFALHGRDEAGRTAPSYGELLAGTLEDSGELAPGGTASKLLRLAGDMVTDPMAAPALLTGAEAAGALGGAMTPAAAPMRPTMPYRPRSSPTRPPMPARRFDPGATQPVPRFNPTETQPVPTGGAGPTATQPVQVRLGGGPGAPGATQQVPRFSPSGYPGWTETQPVPVSPTDTQRVPMARRGKGPLRPKGGKPKGPKKPKKPNAPQGESAKED